MRDSKPSIYSWIIQVCKRNASERLMNATDPRMLPSHRCQAWKMNVPAIRKYVLYRVVTAIDAKRGTSLPFEFKTVLIVSGWCFIGALWCFQYMALSNWTVINSRASDNFDCVNLHRTIRDHDESLVQRVDKDGFNVIIDLDRHLFGSPLRGLGKNYTTAEVNCQDGNSIVPILIPSISFPIGDNLDVETMLYATFLNATTLELNPDTEDFLPTVRRLPRLHPVQVWYTNEPARLLCAHQFNLKDILMTDRTKYAFLPTTVCEVVLHVMESASMEGRKRLGVSELRSTM
ncbi:uncharacterized protein F5891DRAFT_987112 [Suillus fuscotomentosus]|uniref:Uncharacterized protein n=1 Tax=Suillus fuscotomentosus TaxID=1912939 RepID=A0AAD4DQN3_9AGAM|nr:uncharacterized protein F5891DRAFT_987112 [Suillus fuscotomentosus]KAG1890460.1 hypothetical protein F5891DRAFT_987112 [Suillus fuscotomentosus]